MSYLEKARELQEMLAQDQTWEAFDKFYAEDVVVIEKPTGERREGKEAQRKAIEQWYGMVEEMHGGGIGAITADEENGITTAETWMEVTFKGQGRAKMEEVAVQKWRGDQIIEESFYYHMPGGEQQA